MSVMTVTAGLVAILFFMAACLQIGLYIGSTPLDSLPAYLPGLMINAWPLAVAAVIFVLLDIRLNMGIGPKKTVADEDEIPEAPVHRPVAPPKPRNISYFSVQPQEQAQPAAAAPAQPAMTTPPIYAAASPYASQPAMATPQPDQQSADPFYHAATPPFQQGPPNSAQAQQQAAPKPRDGSGLNFFKI